VLLQESGLYARHWNPILFLELFWQPTTLEHPNLLFTTGSFGLSSCEPNGFAGTFLGFFGASLGGSFGSSFYANGFVPIFF